MKKSATQSQKQTLYLDADHIAAGASDNSSTTGASIDHDLAQLVWKYFGEDQGDAQEVQEDWHLHRGSTQQISDRKA